MRIVFVVFIIGLILANPEFGNEVSAEKYNKTQNSESKLTITFSKPFWNILFNDNFPKASFVYSIENPPSGKIINEGVFVVGIIENKELLEDPINLGFDETKKIKVLGYHFVFTKLSPGSIYKMKFVFPEKIKPGFYFLIPMLIYPNSSSQSYVRPIYDEMQKTGVNVFNYWINFGDWQKEIVNTYGLGTTMYIDYKGEQVIVKEFYQVIAVLIGIIVALSGLLYFIYRQIRKIISRVSRKENQSNNDDSDLSKKNIKSQSSSEIIIPKYDYDFVYVPGGTFMQSDGTNSFRHTISPFHIGRYQVTYELWHTVYQWAISNGYYFANAGKEGSASNIGSAPTSANREPVTRINWRDAIVWCNAYSEKEKRKPVYYSDAELKIPIKDSRGGSGINKTPGSYDNPYVNWNANGYRLPTEGEWEYSARHVDGSGWTPWNYASGATADYNDAIATGDVAWYDKKKTREVGGMKAANALGIYDMSGNVWEWCWDWYYGDYPDTATNYKGPKDGSLRVNRGGGWYLGAFLVQAGARIRGYPYRGYFYLGFRLVRGR